MNALALAEITMELRRNWPGYRVTATPGPDGLAGPDFEIRSARTGELAAVVYRQISAPVYDCSYTRAPGWIAYASVAGSPTEAVRRGLAGYGGGGAC